MLSVLALDFSVGDSPITVCIHARPRLFEFVQSHKKNLFVLACWNGCHSIGSVMNLYALVRVLRAAGREELDESLDTSKPFAVHGRCLR